MGAEVPFAEDHAGSARLRGQAEREGRRLHRDGATGAETAAASKAAAIKGMEEMSARFKAEGGEIYLSFPQNVV